MFTRLSAMQTTGNSTWDLELCAQRTQNGNANNHSNNLKKKSLNL